MTEFGIVIIMFSTAAIVGLALGEYMTRDKEESPRVKKSKFLGLF